MESGLRGKSCRVMELEPLVFRLVPGNLHQSPWKYFPKGGGNVEGRVRNESLQKRRRLMLEIPSVKNKSQVYFDENKMFVRKKMGLKCNIIKFRSLSPLKKK